MISAGKLDQRITVQEKSSTRDAVGGTVDTWSDVATMWARVEPLRSREWFAAAQMQDSTDHRVTVRYRTDITRDMRVVWRGGNLEIVGEPIDVNGRKETLELMCASGVRNG